MKMIHFICSMLVSKKVFYQNDLYKISRHINAPFASDETARK